MSHPRLTFQRSRRRLLLGISAGAALAPLVVAHTQARAEAPAAGAPAAPAATRRVPLRLATLSNGLRLLCRTNDSSEMVSIVCQVKAGLPDERDDQAGLAALTAEAILKGTTTHTPNGFGTALINAGGDLRTLPGFDLTEVSAVCDRTQFDAALKLLADIVAHPSLTEEQVTEARTDLKQRINRFEEDFTGASYQSLLGQLYPKTPYGRPINGFPDSLDRLKAADVRKFWQEHYLQNRMVVAIVGDVDSSKALETAQKAFQSVPWKPPVPAPAPVVEGPGKTRTDLIQRPGPAAQLMVGYRTPGVTRENYPVYAVLDAIIGGGKRGRLFSNIREKHSLGYQLGSFYQPLQQQSHLVGYVVTPPYRRNPRTEMPESVIDLVKTHLLAQYQELGATGPTDPELVRGRNYVIGRYALRQERTRDQAKWLAWNVAMGLGADFDDYFSRRVGTVTKEQVQQAAKALTGQEALVITLPDEAQPER